MKLIGAMDCAWCRIPRQAGHREHDDFLYSSRPTEVPAEHGRAHNTEQINKIPLPLDLKRMTSLHDLGQGTMSFYLLFCENELIINVKQNEQAADDQSPMRQQTKRP